MSFFLHSCAILILCVIHNSDVGFFSCVYSVCDCVYECILCKVCVRLIIPNTSKYFVHHVPCAYVFILLHATYMFIFTHRDEMILMHAHIFLSLLGIKIMAFKLNGLSVRFCSNKLLFYWKEKKNCKSSLYYKVQTTRKYIIFNLDWIAIWYDSVLDLCIPLNTSNATIWLDFICLFLSLHFWVSVHFSYSPAIHAIHRQHTFICIIPFCYRIW